MKIFLVTACLIFSAGALAGKSFTTGSDIFIPSDEGVVPMLQTATGETFTRINILSGKGAVWSFQTDPPTADITVNEITHSPSLYKVYQLSMEGLEVDTTYTLSIFNRNGSVIEKRTFKTFSRNRRQLRIAFGSCMVDCPTFQGIAQRIWGQVEKLRPDLILLGGDNVYVDEWHFLGKKVLPKSNQIWHRYVDSFQRLPLFKFKNLIPSLSTWDDHDYGKNDSNRTWGQDNNGWNPVQEAKKSFYAFFGSEEGFAGKAFKNGPGVSSRFDVAKHRFVLLDNRTFRSPTDGPFAHFGEKQENFLIQQIQSSPFPLVIVSGGQFFGGYLETESFEHSHPEHFKSFKQRIKNFYSEHPSPKPFVLISGDIHFSEIMRIGREQFGFPTYELTSSPWHSRLRPVHSSLENPRRIWAVEGHNFLFARSSYGNDALNMELSAYGPEGRVDGTGFSFSIKSTEPFWDCARLLSE